MQFYFEVNDASIPKFGTFYILKNYLKFQTRALASYIKKQES